MSSTGNVPTVPGDYGWQEGTQPASSGDFGGSQQWQQPGQGQQWQQRDQSQQWQQRDQSQQWQDRERGQQQQSDQNQDWNQPGSQIGESETNDANDGNFRPMNVQNVREGGVAVDGREGLPQGKASLTDKVVGKVEKVTGKMSNNPEKHERGELREAGRQRGRKRSACTP